jgi:hypothetical protein
MAYDARSMIIYVTEGLGEAQRSTRTGTKDVGGGVKGKSTELIVRNGKKGANPL